MRNVLVTMEKDLSICIIRTYEQRMLRVYTVMECDDKASE